MRAGRAAGVVVFGGAQGEAVRRLGAEQQDERRDEAHLDDDDDREDPLGYCNTFEASSNGETGFDRGVLRRGDAMMFNQNVWHRGPRNFDLDHVDENRVMFIMTFISRRDFEEGKCERK